MDLLPFLSLSLLVALVSMIGGGVITRAKSDLTKLDNAISDCERLIRYILLPCFVLSHVARGETSTFFSDAFLTSPTVVISLIISAIFEPIFLGLLVQKFYSPSKKDDPVPATINFASRFSLCSHSLALPLAFTFGLDFMLKTSTSSSTAATFKINFKIIRLMIIFTAVLRVICQRFCCEMITETTSSSSENDEEEKQKDEESSSKTQQIHFWATKINTVFGGHAAVVICFVFALIFNKFGGTGTSSSSNGSLNFIVGVADTLADGYVPFTLCIEGYEFARCLWKSEKEKESESEQQDEEVSSRNVVMQYPVIAIQFASRLMICAGLSFIFFSLQTEKNENAVIAIAFSVLSCSMPYTYEFGLLFKKETEHGIVRAVAFQSFFLNVCAAPLVLYYLL